MSELRCWCWICEQRIHIFATYAAINGWWTYKIPGCAVHTEVHAVHLSKLTKSGKLIFPISSLTWKEQFAPSSKMQRVNSLLLSQRKITLKVILLQSTEVFNHDFLRKYFLSLVLSVYLILRISKVVRISNNLRFMGLRPLLNFNPITKMMKKN